MVYLLLAPGFEEIEAITPVDLLRRAGLEVTTVGIDAKMVRGAHGITVEADDVMDNVDFSDIDCLILPGGNPGFKNLERDDAVRDLITQVEATDKLLAAICAAPSILGRMGLLKGKKATVYPGMQDELKGADFVEEPVVVDGNIVTSRGAGTAIAFSGKLIELLKNKATAEEVLKSIVY